VGNLEALAGTARGLASPVDGADELFEITGFLEVSMGIEATNLGRGADIAMTSEHHDLYLGTYALDLLENLFAAHSWHLPVENDHVNVDVRSDPSNGVLAVSEVLHTVAAELKASGE
jgi:hypothetical protein